MNSLPLFDPAHAQDPDAEHLVPGLGAHGQEARGPWLVFWADAGHILHSTEDRSAVMKAQGLDPEAYEIHAPAPILRRPSGWRTWWQARLKEKP